MSNTDLKPIDHSNTIVEQNPENTSLVSIFPLVGNETLEIEENLTIISDLPPAQPPQTTGISY